MQHAAASHSLRPTLIINSTSSWPILERVVSTASSRTRTATSQSSSPLSAPEPSRIPRLAAHPHTLPSRLDRNCILNHSLPRRYGPPPGAPYQQQQQYGYQQPQYAPPQNQPHYAPPPGYPQPQQQQYGTAPVMHYPPPNAPPPQGMMGPPAFQNQPQHYQPPAQNAHQYSNLSGKRKALLIGINYTGTSNALRGCHNDARNVKQFLQRESRAVATSVRRRRDTRG